MNLTIDAIIKDRREDLIRRKAENDALDRAIEKNVIKINECVSELELGQEGLQFLEDLANTRRGGMKKQVENIVTEALSFVYGDDYRVELVYDVKNNRSFAEIELVKTTAEGEIRRQMNGFGGGVSDTISVPLRLLVLLASRQTDRVCILDEAYKHVDLERIDRAAEFMKDVANRLSLQIIMFSHHEAMRDAADAVWVIQDDNGKSISEKVV